MCYPCRALFNTFAKVLNNFWVFHKKKKNNREIQNNSAKYLEFNRSTVFEYATQSSEYFELVAILLLIRETNRMLHDSRHHRHCCTDIVWVRLCYFCSRFSVHFFVCLFFVVFHPFCRLTAVGASSVVRRLLCTHFFILTMAHRLLL